MALRTYYFLATIIMVQAGRSQEKFCDPLTSDTTRQCFIKETLASVPHSPNQITVDALNHVYFSFDAGQGEYMPAKMAIGNATIMVLKGVKDAFSMSYDKFSGEVFFGGSHGIYRYNPVYRTLQRLAVPNLDVWWLVAKNGIYFIRFPSLNAYCYKNKTIKYVYPLQNHSVHQFVFDMDENIFFINSSGLYGIKNGDTKAILLRDYPRFLGMATDQNGYVYVCSEDGIFIVSKMIQKVKRIINVQGVLGMTFDNANNIIYTDSQEIVRLIPVSRDEYYKTVTKP